MCVCVCDVMGGGGGVGDLYIKGIGESPVLEYSGVVIQ